jgi:hypothetical protein
VGRNPGSYSPGPILRQSDGFECSALHGLEDFVARSPAEYEAKAIDLGSHPVKLAEARKLIARNRLTHPLFDAVKFARNLEAAFRRMHERARQGLAPDHIIPEARR